MKKSITTALFSALLVLSLNDVLATDHVLVSEVLYDPLSTESGGEFVELYNPTPHDIDISNWNIATETSMTDATMPENSIIKAYGYYLIADSGWSFSKENSSWPDADHEETISLSNSNGGVALIKEGTIIDAVGWGSSTNINEGLFEGTPVEDVPEGYSLERKRGLESSGNGIDTDNNAEDFLERTNPEPQNSQSDTEISSNEEKNSTTLVLKVTVDVSDLSIDSVNITDDDPLIEGFQVIPNPANEKEVSVKTVITNDKGMDNTNVFAQIRDSTITLTKTTTLDQNSAIFEGVFEMDYYDKPSIYLVNISATDSTGSTTYSEDYFEYMTLSAIEIDSSIIDFNSTFPSSVVEVIGDTDTTTNEKATIRNIGNTEIDIGISGTDLLSATETIPVSNIEFTFNNNNFDSALSGILSYEPQYFDLDLGIQELNELSFRLTVPQNTMPGSYSGTTIITAISS
jgi:hypothetical protein